MSYRHPDKSLVDQHLRVLDWYQRPSKSHLNDIGSVRKMLSLRCSTIADTWPIISNVVQNSGMNHRKLWVSTKRRIIDTPRTLVVDFRTFLPA